MKGTSKTFFCRNRCVFGCKISIDNCSFIYCFLKNIKYISYTILIINLKTSWNKTIVDRESIIKKNTLLDVINGEYSINICDTDRYLEGNRKNKINKQISGIRILGNFIELPNDKEITIYKDKKIIYN